MPDKTPLCPECGGETYSPGTRCDDCLEEEIKIDDDDRYCERHAVIDCEECQR